MSVYVDPIFRWPTKIKCFQGGSCHLFADTVDELHKLAGEIGMKRSWFQNKPGFPHYDLTPQKRSIAVSRGAVEVTARQMVDLKRANRAKSAGGVA